MRKTLGVVLVSLIMLSMVSSVYAESTLKVMEDNIPIIGKFEYNPQLAKEIAQKERLAEEYYQAKIIGNTYKMNHFQKKYVAGKKMYSLESNKRLSIHQVAQEKSNWCGYAAIKSLLDYEGVSKTQTTIATEVYNTSTACPWYLSNGDSRDQFPVPNYLTEKIDFHYVPYPYGAAGTTNITADDVKPKVVSTIDAGHGLMACGRSYGNISGHASILPNYPATEIGHWLSIDGYTNNGDSIYIVDSAKSDVVSWSDNIDRYYSISATKLAAYVKARGLVW
ncbi:C39 family peptidase [Vallitalea guaymasensis]|uniref:C39 family peptidase n=1 Tax=Vallitalea guaymasensis TaxID=1185412 RepID=UPI000DE21CA9|nr:C39 family peptidase [Vallitalea guaymasensis]